MKIRMRTFMFMFLAVLSLLSLAAKCQGEKVKEGYGQEYIAFVEVQNNGLYQIWLRFDNIASYCFDDEKLYEQAQWFISHYPDGITKLHYKGITKEDPLYEKWYESSDSGCGAFGSGSDGTGGTTPLRLISFCIMEPAKVIGEDTPREYYCEEIPEYLLPPVPTLAP